MALGQIPSIAPRAGAIGRPTGATNYLPNGGVEVNVTGWAGINSNTVARETTLAKVGSACVKITRTGTGAILASQNVSTLPAAGHYTFSFWVWIPTSWDGDAITIREGATIGGYVGSTTVVESDASLALRDQWQRVWCVADISASDLDGRIDVQAVSEPSGTDKFVYVDGAQVEPGDYPTPYIETAGAAASRPRPLWIAG